MSRSASVPLPSRLIASFVDGHDLGGFLFHFFPKHPECQIFPRDNPHGSSGWIIDLREVKALFFVREFDDLDPYDRTEFVDPAPGRRIEVFFRDGDRLLGTAQSFDPNLIGFYMVPADTSGNIRRVFVVYDNVRQVRRYVPGAPVPRPEAPTGVRVHSRNLRRSPRVPMQVSMRATWLDAQGRLHSETGDTREVSAHGALLTLRAPLIPGAELELTNLKTEKTTRAMVASIRDLSGQAQVGLELVRPDPKFWERANPF